MRQHDVADRQERKLVHVIAIAIGFHQGSKKQCEVPLPVCPVDRLKGSAGSGLSRAGLSIGRKDFNAEVGAYFGAIGCGQASPFSFAPLVADPSLVAST